MVCVMATPQCLMLVRVLSDVVITQSQGADPGLGPSCRDIKKFCPVGSTNPKNRRDAIALLMHVT